MREFLAIDIGASSGRHILGRLEQNKLILEEIYRFPNSPYSVNGRLMWDVERLFAEILNGMRRAGELGRIPESVGIDTWAVDYALLGGDLRPIGGVCSYRDGRTAQVIPAVHAKIPFETLYARTGIQFQPFNTVYQLADDIRTGRIDSAEHLLMLPDYFHWLLTGVMSREYTNATSTGLINAATKTWDDEILHALKLKPSLFSPTMSAGTVLGGLKKEIAERVGYDANVVLPATHDTASAVLAAPFGGAYLSSGTWSLIGVEQERPVLGGRAEALNYTNEGGAFGGVRLQKNIMGLWLLQQVRHEEGDRYSFSELARLAREAHCERTVDVDDPRFLSPANMRAEIEQAAGGKMTTGEVCDCIFKSLAKSYAAALGEVEELTGKRFSSLNVIGGGAKNGYLNELTAAATGRRVLAGPVEATAIGNLAVQMIAAGEFTGLCEARETIKTSFGIEEIV